MEGAALVKPARQSETDPAAESPADDVAIVIPAYQAAGTLTRVLPAAIAAAAGAEVILVDAGSTDGTAEVAKRYGVTVIRLADREGPARARNVGVDHAEADIVLFLDSDCVPHADVVARVSGAFGSTPSLVSLTGSYDSSPAESGFFSLYMNLRHHFTHQRANREPATFWAGCGAVRRDAFVAVGGFDADRYPRPAIEDIELGTRLSERGRTQLDPELQVTHLKRWTLASVVSTDVLQRAVPWSRLVMERNQLPNDLNLRWTQRIAAAVAPLALVGVGLSIYAIATGSVATLGLAVIIAAPSAAFNWPMLRAFASLRGLRFALSAWLFHQIHLIYASATFAVCALWHRMRPPRRAQPGTG